MIQFLSDFFPTRRNISKRLLVSVAIACATILLSTEALTAQNDEVTLQGKVVDEKGSPLPGATVQLKGTTGGTVTDAEGNFSIAVSGSATLVVSFVGYRTKEVDVSPSMSNITIDVEADVQNLGEVVVTALGIKKEKRVLGYAIQEVKGEDLTKAREPNILGNLTGKVAGLRISNSADFFSAPDITLRGVKPLIVLNGTPLESSTLWEISGDDVESYVVLKGPAASALYGARGVNGAIQITTKRGAGKSPSMTVEFNSSNTFDLSLIAQPKVQHEYGTGYQGKYVQGDATDEYWGAWGPKLDGRLLVQYNSPINPDGTKQPIPWIARGKDNLQHFLGTGYLSTNNVSFSTTTENTDLRASISQTYQKGVVPNTKLGGTTFNLGGGANLGKKFRFDASVNYNKLYTPNYPSVGYGRKSFIYGLTLWTGDNVDVRDLANYWEPGQTGIQQRNFEGANDYNNPYFVAYEQTNGYYQDSFFGNASLGYKILPTMNITLRSGVNNYARYQPVVTPKSFNYPRIGNYSETWYNMFEANTFLLIDYSKKFGDFDLKATGGASVRNWNERNISASTDGLAIPEWNNFDNSLKPHTPTNYKHELVEYGTYATVDIGYKDYVYLGLTGRYDKSSTLPLNNNGYFYPSVSLTTILNEYVKLPAFISYAKLRAAVTRVGAGMAPYSAVNSYSADTRWNNNPTLSYPNTLLSSTITPSFSTGVEAGTEWHFFTNRASLDLTYFDFVDGPQTSYQSISTTSGFGQLLVNGRKTERKGWEIMLNVEPVRTTSFKWNVGLNWSMYRQYLKDLAPGNTSEGLIKVGDRLDIIQGTGFMYSSDGQLIIGTNGVPQTDGVKKNLGFYGDSWIGGITNTFLYKQFSFSFSLDARVGGKIVSTYERYLWAGGRHLGIEVKDREDWYNGKDYTVPGVKVVSGSLQRNGDGVVTSDTREYAPNDSKTNYFDYIQRTRGYYGPDEAAIISRGYLKWREAVITWRVPKSVFHKSVIKSADISLVGRNLMLFTTSGVIDPDQFTGAYDNLQTPAFRRMGINLNVRF